MLRKNGSNGDTNGIEYITTLQVVYGSSSSGHNFVHVEPLLALVRGHKHIVDLVGFLGPGLRGHGVEHEVLGKFKARCS